MSQSVVVIYGPPGCDKTQAAEQWRSIMLEIYTMGVIEINGQEFPVEVDFEWREGKPIIHAVSALKTETQPGGIWYDEKGVRHVAINRRIKRLDVMEFVDLKEWEEEISTYYEYLAKEVQ